MKFPLSGRRQAQSWCAPGYQCGSLIIGNCKSFFSSSSFDSAGKMATGDLIKTQMLDCQQDITFVEIACKARRPTSTIYQINAIFQSLLTSNMIRCYTAVANARDRKLNIVHHGHVRLITSPLNNLGKAYSKCKSNV